jgi:hypothetical protein
LPRLPDHLRLPATRRFQSTITNVVGRATPALYRAWDDLDDYDEDSVDTLAAKAAPTLTAVKATAVRSAVGYYTVLAGVRPPRVATGDVSTAADMRAPFISTWQALASGNAYDAAVAAGRSRLEAVLSDFAVSASRQTGDVFVARANVRVHGWERITDSGACPWCEEVAGETYSSAEAADFGHDRCNCTAAPLIA